MKLYYLFSFLFILITSNLYAQIDMNDSFNIGDPIVANSEQEATIYLWEAENTAVIEVNGNRTAHIWANIGKYKIRLTTIDINFDNKTVNYKRYNKNFEVKGASSKEVPVAPPAPLTFSYKIKEALSKVPADVLHYKNTIANNYKNVADEVVESPAIWNPAEMVNEVKKRNLSTTSNKWSNFYTELSKILKELNLDNSDLKGHIDAFYEVSKALE